MELNEKKTINIPKDEAYGESREDLIQEVQKSELPEEIKPEVGMGLVQIPGWKRNEFGNFRS